MSAWGKRDSVVGIVLRVRAILIERHGIFDFARHRPDVHVDVEAAQSLHELGIEIGDRHRREREAFGASVARRDAKPMVDEIEDDIEGAPA